MEKLDTPFFPDMRLRRVPQEVCRQRRDVLRPLAQRRQVELDGLEAVVEVEPEHDTARRRRREIARRLSRSGRDLHGRCELMEPDPGGHQAGHHLEELHAGVEGEGALAPPRSAVSTPWVVSPSRSGSA